MPTHTHDVEVSPALIKWARDNAGLQPEEAEKRTGISKSHLAALENGTASISWAEVKKLAEGYKTPLAVFFLADTPTSYPKPKDYRTIGSRDHKELSFRTTLMLRKARMAQEVAEDLYASLGVDFRFKLSTYNLNSDPDRIAGDIRNRLQLSYQKQEDLKNAGELFDYLRMGIEDLGVLVRKSAQHNHFPLEDARAISLIDREPYVIIINNRDVDAAQVFSLAHEFCHVLLRRAGICNDFDYYVGDRANEIKRIESFCNQFAATLLVPENEFRAHPDLVGTKRVDEDALDDILNSLSVSFKVSKTVILRRLLSFDFITKKIYESKVEDWENRRQPPKSRGGRNNPARTALAVNGPTFTTLTVRAYQERKISYANVSDYLGIKPKYIPNLERILHKR